MILFGSLATHGDQSYDGAPYLTAISVAFMTGFALLNVTSSGIEILIPLVRLPIEAIRWSMMAKELSGDRPASFLTTTSTVSQIILF